MAQKLLWQQCLKSVCRPSFNYNNILEGHKNWECVFSRKFKKPILCFQLEVFFLFFLCVFSAFSLRFFCVHYFSSTLLVMIRTTKRQRTNKASNINKIIYCNYNIMTKSRSDATLNFPKNYWICSYVGVIYSTCNIRDSFCFT